MSEISQYPNLSPAAQGYLENLGMGVEDLFHHVLAVLHDPAYRVGQRRGAEDGVAAHPAARLARLEILRERRRELAASAARGQELAQLLDSETPVPGVTTGTRCAQR